MIKGHVSGTDGNCLRGSEERESPSLLRALGIEGGRAAGRFGARGLGSKSQLCPKVGDLGQRSVSLWASVSSPVKWEPG